MTYTIFISITVIISIISYTSVYAVAEKNNEQLHMAMLRHTNDILTQYLSAAESVAKEIQANPDINSFLTQDIYNRNSDYYNPLLISKLSAVLQSYNPDGLLSAICLYSHKSEVLLTTDSIFNPIKLTNLIKFDDMSFEEFKNNYLTNISYNNIYPAMNITYGTNKFNAILYTTSFPICDDAISSNLIILINADKMLNIIENTFRAPDSYIYFYHKNSVIAKSSGAPELDSSMLSGSSTAKIDGSKYVLFTSQDENNDYFVIASPTSSVSKQLYQLRIMIIVLLLLSALIYFAAAIIFSRRNMRPIDAIKQHFDQELGDEEPDEYKMISNSIGRLIDTKNELQSEFDKNIPFLTSNMLQMLINGQITESDAVKDMCRRTKLTITNDKHILLIIILVDDISTDITDIEKAIIAKEYLHKALSTELEYISCEPYVSELTLMIKTDTLGYDNVLESIERTINPTSSSLYEQLSVKLKAAVSGEFYGTDDMFFEYQQLYETITNGLCTEFGSTLWYTPAQNLPSNYYYPIDIENKLIQYMRQNNLEQAYSVIDNILLKNNTDERILFNDTIYCLNYNLKATVYKIINNLKLPTDEKLQIMLTKLDEYLPTIPFFEIIKEVLSYISSLSSGNSDDTNLAALFLSYIESSYTDPNFCRHTFAEKFHITDDYASKIFKEYTGYQFLEYLTRLRMENACAMLLNSDKSIEVIANASGYNSAAAFRRVFKTYSGMTPREYKNSHTR